MLLIYETHVKDSKDTIDYYVAALNPIFGSIFISKNYELTKKDEDSLLCTYYVHVALLYLEILCGR